jgi:tetratricopeptide (TPR) repeat protein
MRRIALTILLATALLSGGGVRAQFNKSYFYYVGREFLIDSRYREAIETLNILLKVDPDAYEGYWLRGIAKYNLDDLLGAESDFTMAIEKNPVFTMAYQYRAITRSRLGNYDDALGDFREAIDLRPDLPGPYYSRGVTYLLSQQFREAIGDFDMFIRREGRVADAYIHRGTCYLYLKDTVRAYQEYELAIKTNRENPDGYVRRGALYMAQDRNSEALADFNKAVECDSNYVAPYFNRAILYSRMTRPMLSLSDFDRVISIDSTSSLAYFNRAIVRSQIGDYNRALEDYDKVALYSPGNVLVYYNRAGLRSQLGDMEAAVDDYSRAIELYPDFANAYLGRANLRYLLKDSEGSRRDRNIAERKIAEYRDKLSDSTFSIWADTSRQFNQLLSFDTKLGGNEFGKMNYDSEPITLLPLFKFTLAHADTTLTVDPNRYWVQKAEDFRLSMQNPLLVLSTRPSDISPDSLINMDRLVAARLDADSRDWKALFQRGVTQSLIRQYTNAVSYYEKAIGIEPANPFLYINLSTTRSEMIDFVSSISSGYQRISVDSDPANRLKSGSTRTYNYDEAIGELNKAAKLLPDFAHIYYNRAGLQALSGNLPEAFDDYTRAIELNPGFAEAYYNRGLVQIFLNDTRKGCLDVSKAGELGIVEAYNVLKRYARPD